MKQVSQPEFTKLVQEGKTKAELAKYYGLSSINIVKILEDINKRTGLDLKFKKKIKPKFEIVWDLEPTEQIKKLGTSIDSLIEEREEEVNIPTNADVPKTTVISDWE